jgi:hypothetical protein
LAKKDKPAFLSENKVILAKTQNEGHATNSPLFFKHLKIVFYILEKI